VAQSDRLRELAESLGARLVLPSGPVAVALSGGADSAALLWLLSEREVETKAIHVFHGLPASSLMSTAAGQVAAACGVRMEMAFVDPAGTSELHLREARMAALAERAEGRPILLAHTTDDQAETVLMRILRGTGVTGAAGIRTHRGDFRHPMLAIRREETRELAKLAGLPFRDDPANEDRANFRNRLRLDVFPALDEALGRSAREAFVSFAAGAAEESAVLDELARRVPIQHRDGAARLPLGTLVAVGDAAAARALRVALTTLAAPYPPDRASVERILDVVHGRARATDAGSGLRASVSGPFLIVAPSTKPEPEMPPPTQLMGESVRWGRWTFELSEVEGPIVAPLSPRRIAAPADAGPWAVRVAHGADRVTGRRVRDALTDAGVTERAGWPLVTCDGEPVWIPAVRSRVWPVHAPGRYLCAVAFREPNWQTFEP
jgi:tRNA(Ile)-lysidine synthase